MRRPVSIRHVRSSGIIDQIDHAAAAIDFEREPLDRPDAIFLNRGDKDGVFGFGLPL